ncbi:SP_1767 family glycosyltransferase [Bacillus sp. 1P10SD]|uniref:SP_1767 family glycosyltransferase n=1 Tax=Bacillus sp. 1P10SD TaxID=3132265 RepID=UPI0039A5796E
MRDFVGKNILVNVWNYSFNILLNIKKAYLTLVDNCVIKVVRPPYVSTIDQTIEKIIKEKCSVSRYGDGELKLIAGRDISFQKHSSLLEQRLKELLVSNEDNHIVCIPDIFKDNTQYTKTYAKAWKDHLIYFRLKWYKNLRMQKKYYNAFISRCYLCYQDQSKSKYFFNNLKKIWNNRDIVLVEGEFSRLGVGNDLFDNANSIRRILCPKRDAFSIYKSILEYLKTFKKDTLILIALGPSATVLSYDLYKEGFQAIDIGHIDVEYEWYLKGATKKEPVKNKFVNEVNGGVFEEELINKKYYDQILINLNTIS